MIKSNFKKKLFLIAVFIFILSFNVLAQNIDVNIYGAADSVQPASGTTGESISVVSSSDNVVINKYSSDYLFSLSAATANPTVCICSNFYDKIFIKNTAPYEATFSIMTNIPEYVKLPYSTLKLQPGMATEMNVLVSADCSANRENLDYNILVSNNFGTQYTIERKLLVDRCQSISSTLYASKEKINPCESVVYTVELKNPAPFAEEYIVKPRNSQYFDRKEYSVTLEPNKKSYLNFTYSPECTVYGNKEIEFSIESVGNELTAKLTHNLLIERAYDFFVSNDENISLCREKETIIPIKVKNTAGLENEFYFSLVNKQDFTRVEAQQATIKPGEEFTFLVFANPTSSTKTEAVLDFEIKTKLGNMDYKGSINLKTNDCYGIDVKILADKNPELCSGTYTYDVLVKNNGLFEERIFISDDSDYAEVFPSTVILAPSESRNVSLTLSLPDENMNNIKFNVIASTDSQTKTWKDSFSVDVKKKSDCTFLVFEKQKLYARYGTENISFRVENKGSIEDSYFISYEGTDLIKLDTEEIKLKPGEFADIVLKTYADRSEKQNKFGFKITASSSNDDIYENNMVLKMTDTPLFQKLYYKVTSTICTTVASVLLLLILLGLILIIILAVKGVRIPFAMKIVFLVIIVIILIVVLAARGLPESRYTPIDKSLIDKSNLYWYEDQTYQLDLNEYFFDPDNDTLGFSVEDTPANISVKINGANVVFTPDKDWSGNARVRFVAEDTYGEKIISSRINLNVIEVAEFSWTDFFFRNCVYINALLLIMLLSLVFLLRTKRESEPGTKKVVMSGIKKEKGFLYFVDKDGDVSKTPMARSNKKNQTFKKEKVGKIIGKRKK